MHRQGEEKFLLCSNNRNPRIIPHKYLLSSFITSQQGVIKTALDFQTQIKIETCLGNCPCESQMSFYTHLRSLSVCVDRFHV